MSQKFEKLLDLLVNEEKDKAEDLFHEIVVDKSREIYEELVSNDAENESIEETKDENVDEMAHGDKDKKKKDKMKILYLIRRIPHYKLVVFQEELQEM